MKCPVCMNIWADESEVHQKVNNVNTVKVPDWNPREVRRFDIANDFDDFEVKKFVRDEDWERLLTAYEDRG